jgi:protein SCO1/2
MSNSWFRRGLWAALVLVMLSLGTAAAYKSWRQSMQRQSLTLPTLHTIGDFTLIERSGQTIRKADLAGKIWVADFIFTSCPGPCPILSSRLQELQQALVRTNDVRLVSFSVDPATDTPEILRAYAKKFQADPTKWWFLTGTKAQMDELIIKSFLLPIEANPGGAQDPAGAFMHSSRLVLVDRKGAVRGLFDGLDNETVPRVLKAIGFLLEEP